MNFIWYRHTKMSCRVVLHFVAMVIVVGDIRFVPRMNKMEQAINKSIKQLISIDKPINQSINK